MNGQPKSLHEADLAEVRNFRGRHIEPDYLKARATVTRNERTRFLDFVSNRENDWQP